MTQTESEDMVFHAELLRRMLEDKRKEVAELEKRWLEATTKLTRGILK
jgi:hypothetical protein